jgi:superfamily II DNA helicase RecQ
MEALRTSAIVRRRLILVAIDELHRNTKEQWGGKFRPAMGKLYEFRHRLPDHIPMLGVTATLRAAMYQEVITASGFRDSATLVRHPVNRPKTLYHFEATADSVGQWRCWS